MIPKDLRDFILWKLTAVNPKETHLHTEADLNRDGDFDLGKGNMRPLSKMLKKLVAEKRIVKHGAHYGLAGKRPYKNRYPESVPPLVLTAETKAMQARMDDAAEKARRVA